MVNQKQYITELTTLGLTLNESKTYITLLTKNSLTVGEIAQISRVPRTKLYGVIENLITKGFCIEKAGDVKRYRAVDPNIVMNKLLKDYQEQLEQKKQFAQNFSNVYFPIYQQNIGKTDSLDYIQVLKEKNRIAETFNTLVKNAKSEILVFTKAPYTSKFSNSIKKSRLDIMKGTIRIKSLYDVEEIKKQDFLSLVEICAETGEEVKISNSLPLKLAIFDETIVMFALRDRITLKPSLTSVFIEHPDFAKAFKRIFYSYWEEAITLEEFKNKEKL